MHASYLALINSRGSKGTEMIRERERYVEVEGSPTCCLALNMFRPSFKRLHYLCGVVESLTYFNLCGLFTPCCLMGPLAITRDLMLS